jgi:hypothetical protein
MRLGIMPTEKISRFCSPLPRGSAPRGMEGCPKTCFCLHGSSYQRASNYATHSPLLDLELASPCTIQERNAIAPTGRFIRLIDFYRAHG